MTLKMQYSGYDEQFRYEVVKSALSAYQGIMEKVKEGQRPLYRPRNWKRDEREKERRSKIHSWYSKGDYESVLFIPSTPNGELKKVIQGEINRSTLKIKVVERSGTSITSLLQRSNPMKEENCGREDCFLCTTGGKGDCSRNNVVYEIECDRCGSRYVGETARNGYTRGKEHLKLLNDKDRSSRLWKHCEDRHEGETQHFTMIIKKTFQQDTMLRQIREAVEIKAISEEKSMNCRDEMNTVYIPRARIEER